MKLNVMFIKSGIHQCRINVNYECFIVDVDNGIYADATVDTLNLLMACGIIGRVESLR